MLKCRVSSRHLTRLTREVSVNFPQVFSVLAPFQEVTPSPHELENEYFSKHDARREESQRANSIEDCCRDNPHVHEARDNERCLVQLLENLDISGRSSSQVGNSWHQNTLTTCFVSISEMAARSLTTFLWFDTEALEAARFYVDLFPNSRLGEISYYQADAQRPAGSVLTVEFELFGMPFAALNGGPQFPHTEAVSFQVSCDSQEDVDRIWDAIVNSGGSESMCGWCKDRWGVSWQVIPTALTRALQGLDGYDSQFAFQAMMKMSKIVVADLSKAQDI